MPRILGIDLPEYKKTLYALQALYGVGKTRALEVCVQANVSPDKRARELSNDEVNRIQRILDQYELEGDLRRMINDNIDRVKRIRAYRGLRHAAKLPARGQRTRTNSRSARGGGRRKTVGSLTKEMAAKLEAK
jgi:small subunit ribosomal protein S13